MVLHLGNDPVKGRAGACRGCIQETSISQNGNGSCSEGHEVSILGVLLNGLANCSDSGGISHGEDSSIDLLVDEFDGEEVFGKRVLHMLIVGGEHEGVRKSGSEAESS